MLNDIRLRTVETMTHVDFGDKILCDASLTFYSEHRKKFHFKNSLYTQLTMVSYFQK